MTASKNDFELGTFLGFALKEIFEVQIYINAAIIGFTVCLFTQIYSLVPFIVPMFVQVITRSHIKYRQRHFSALVELPAQAEAPVFIMDLKGDVLISVGRTSQLFQKHAISNIEGFLNREALDGILKIADTAPSAGSPHPAIEAFSVVSMKWYKINATRMKEGDRSGQILVWFQDISLRKTYDFRLKDLLRYSGSLIHDLGYLVETGQEFEHLSSFLLKDYGAVFITRMDQGKNLVGSVYKQSSNRIEKSDAIVINNKSAAPINISRQKAQIITGDIDDYDSMATFLKKNPLDPKVLAFIDVPIHNFITYNEADLSIIAFNYKCKITSYEKRFFEILVNTYRTMIMMVDLKKKTQ